MRASEFAARGAAVLGGYGWKMRLSRGTGVNYATVKRWAAGSTPVPPLAITTLRLLEALTEAGRPLPAEFA